MKYIKHAFNILPVLALMAAIALPMTFAMAQDESDTPSEEAKPEDKTDYKKLKSPVPYTKRSISRGRTIFQRYCTECHGPDGKALIDIIADATDLTAPHRWYSGTTEGEVFRSIRDGAGVSMPPYKTQFKKEEDLWHLTNFVRSLWPKDKQPKLQEMKKKSESNTESGGVQNE